MHGFDILWLKMIRYSKEKVISGLKRARRIASLLPVSIPLIFQLGCAFNQGISYPDFVDKEEPLCGFVVDFPHGGMMELSNLAGVVAGDIEMYENPNGTYSYEGIHDFGSDRDALCLTLYYADTTDDTISGRITLSQLRDAEDRIYDEFGSQNGE